MFRYVAFCWPPNSAKATADGFRASLCASGPWVPALRAPGLAVYVIGCEAGVNEAYPLPPERGVVIGRLFRRSDLNATPSAAVHLTDHEGARIVASDGRALVAEFWGRYIAFLPSSAGVPRVLRDPTGALPCYHLRCDGVSVIFSWLEDVLNILPPASRPRIDWSAIRALMLLGSLGGHESGLDGVRQILPGELVTFDAGSHRAVQLWRAVDVALDPTDVAVNAAEQALRRTVMACVHHWTSCYDAILLRLSGGVDSAILLASLSQAVAADRITCLNYHSPGADSDERRYARLAAAKASARLIERHRDLDFNLSTILDTALTPTPSSYVGRMGTGRIDAQTAAENGARAIFTGVAGDSLFFQTRGTLPAADYLALRGLDRGFAHAVVDAARLGRVSVWHALRHAFIDRFDRRNPLAGVGRHLTLMAPEAMEVAMHTATRFIHPDLFRAAGVPPAKFRQLTDLISPVDYYDPFQREAAPEFVSPLLSQPLIELCLQIPTFTLTHGGMGRALARRAFSGLIPGEIENRRSKGGMSEHVTEILDRHRDLAKALLLEGHLARQGLVDRALVERSLDGRSSTGVGYVGEVHQLLAVEAWCQTASNLASGQPWQRHLS